MRLIYARLEGGPYDGRRWATTADDGDWPPEEIIMGPRQDDPDGPNHRYVFGRRVEDFCVVYNYDKENTA